MFKIFDKKFNFGKIQKKRAAEIVSTMGKETTHEPHFRMSTDYKPTKNQQEKCLPSNSGKEICCICLDKHADAVLFPCCHGKICFGCGKEMLAKGTCHLCRNVLC